MCPLARSGWLYLLTALIALTALGCSQNLENNEQYQAQVSRLERMDEDLKNAQKTISRMETEFQQAAKEIVALKAAVGSGRAAGAPGGAASDATLKALEQRLTLLEGQAHKSVANPAALAPSAPRTQVAAATETADVPEADAPAAAGAGKTVTPKMRGSAAPAAKPIRGQMTVVAKPAGIKATGAVKGTAAKKKTARPATLTAKAASASAPSSSSGGFYHQIGASDTVASIAAKYNVPAGDIVKANGLQGNFRLAIGNSLYIPRKGGA